MWHVTPRFCAACGGALQTNAQTDTKAAPFVCSSCGLRVYLDPKVAVATVVTVGGGIVLCRRAQKDKAHGKWVLPGGFVDRFEEVELAAVREVREETGLELQDLALLGVFSYADEPVVVVAYRATAQGVPQKDRESLDIRIFDKSSIPWSTLGFASTSDALKAALG